MFPKPPEAPRPKLEDVLALVATMWPSDRARLRVALLARYDVRGESQRGYADNTSARNT